MTDPSARSCRLRPMRADDLDRICRIEGNSFPNPWSRKSFLGDLRSSLARCTVALADKRVVGYSVGWFVIDELHVLNLAVDPGYRRRGIGRELLVDLLAAAGRRGCHYAALELRESNRQARRLYEEHGFRPVAVRKRYYRRPAEDALVMWLDLGSGTGPGDPGPEVTDGVVSKG